MNNMGDMIEEAGKPTPEASSRAESVQINATDAERDSVINNSFKDLGKAVASLRPWRCQHSPRW